jgi:urea carboxylase
MWNRFRATADFAAGKPWLLRFFDQIRFFPVTEQELLEFRENFPRGRVKLEIESTSFRLRDYQEFLRRNGAAIRAFKQKQQTAFDAERERWRELPAAPAPMDPDPLTEISEQVLAPGEIAVRAQLTGSVWQILVEPGSRVRAGDRLLVLEAMKMETAVLAPADGVVGQLSAKTGALVSAGQTLLVLVAAKALD